jgi:hypothetical protein
MQQCVAAQALAVEASAAGHSPLQPLRLEPAGSTSLVAASSPWQRSKCTNSPTIPLPPQPLPPMPLPPLSAPPLQQAHMPPDAPGSLLATAAPSSPPQPPRSPARSLHCADTSDDGSLGSSAAAAQTPVRRKLHEPVRVTAELSASQVAPSITAAPDPSAPPTWPVRLDGSLQAYDRVLAGPTESTNSGVTASQLNACSLASSAGVDTLPGMPWFALARYLSPPHSVSRADDKGPASDGFAAAFDGKQADQGSDGVLPPPAVVRLRRLRAPEAHAAAADMASLGVQSPFPDLYFDLRQRQYVLYVYGVGLPWRARRGPAPVHNAFAGNPGPEGRPAALLSATWELGGRVLVALPPASLAATHGLCGVPNVPDAATPGAGGGSGQATAPDQLGGGGVVACAPLPWRTRLALQLLPSDRTLSRFGFLLEDLSGVSMPDPAAP